ncbi:hypothetical protein [Actinokineospora sp. NBRC 105648]|uniref:hypothetical protein n=1 Tax=Actinokineospora sp. NBRC 105648 TaxID=3032206 RepID=UPI0024A0123E|nr:hypothetical protein [Actinokineospora sp. NBRC 105648]GLZ38742.1 hypothetical protein Acsp05_23660 [Actinokineospora sp. NBRC 105648]
MLADGLEEMFGSGRVAVHHRDATGHRRRVMVRGSSGQAVTFARPPDALGRRRSRQPVDQPRRWQRQGSEGQAKRTISSEVWRSHLRRGELLRRADPVDLTVAYYANCLRSPGRQGDAEGLDDLSSEARELVAAWLVELGVPAGDIAGLPDLADPAGPGLGRATPSPVSAPSGDIRGDLFREVATYLGTD